MAGPGHFLGQFLFSGSVHYLHLVTDSIRSDMTCKSQVAHVV